jgi:NADH:ubiquinone oxidoreductase subunit K
VNWSTSEACKRCNEPIFSEAQDDQFDAREDAYYRQPSAQQFEPANERFFSGGVVLLTGMLIVAAVLFLIQQVGHPFDRETARGIGGIVGLMGFGLMFLAHIWLMIRIFEQSIGWGFASLCIPFVVLAAVAKFWLKTRRSFVGQMICVAIMLTGIGIGT